MTAGWSPPFHSIKSLFLDGHERSAGKPDPEPADLIECHEPRLGHGVGQAGRQQVMKRRQRLEPAGRRRLDGEPVKDPAGDA